MDGALFLTFGFGNGAISPFFQSPSGSNSRPHITFRAEKLGQNLGIMFLDVRLIFLNRDFFYWDSASPKSCMGGFTCNFS